jgi:FixJ family two-component response regulator
LGCWRVLAVWEYGGGPRRRRYWTPCLIRPAILEYDEAAARFAQLTPREIEVMELIAAGNHTKRIAAQLDIQGRTVDVHRFNIMRKVGVRTLAELLQCWSVARQAP